MSQNDLVIANQTFPNTRADINSALQALGSLSSGATEPTTPYANMLWYDTSVSVSNLKIRAEDNASWITMGTVDQSAGTFEPSENGVDLSGLVEARGYIAFNGSTGSTIRSQNITLTKVSTGNYTLTMDVSVRADGSNWAAIVGTVDRGIDSQTAVAGLGGNTQIYNAYVSGRTDSTITLRARNYNTSWIHQGGNDNNSAYSWGISAVDPTYISVVVY
ncbi:hypothetical protein N9796_00325 [bacterium]|nr:hypothetical protein [bacterium]MDB4277767.1 hypothetical protein [Gammaproteobacteria bacterium]MDB4352812.1 hypothetical protein [Porticoccaceae bacterium]MDB9844228.1 hypothetical protein [Porticoccaceae bacterium]